MSCTSCPNNFMLDGGLCMECLGSQFYDPPTQTCKTCHESCRACRGPGQYSCVSCAFPLHLDRLNNQCVPCCSMDASPDDQSCCHCDKDTGLYEMTAVIGRTTISSGNRQTTSLPSSHLPTWRRTHAICENMSFALLNSISIPPARM